MAPPGSLNARYEKLAGDETRRLESYVVRKELGYGIDEWRALPWWHRRLYLEQMQAESERIREAAGRDGEESGPSNIADALLSGTMGDVAALGFG